MVPLMLYVVLFVAWTNAVVIPSYPHRFLLPSPAPSNEALSKRTVSRPPDGPIQQDFDFRHVLPARHVLFGDGSGLTVTCVSCVMEGEFRLEMDFGIDAAVISEISALATSAATIASAVVSEASDVATAAASVITSIIADATASAAGIAASASSIVSDVVASASPVAHSVASDAEGFFTSVLPNIFGFHRADPLRRDLMDPLTALNDFEISLHQVAPVKADFQLEFSTGDNAVEVELAVPAAVPGVLPLGCPTIPIGPVNFGLIIQPLALTFSASLKPNVNFTLSYGTDIVFERPLIISNQEAQDASPNITIRSNPSNLNHLDSSLCVSASLGPSFNVRFEIPDTGIGMDVDAQFDLAKIGLCINELSDVDDQCQPQGDLSRALGVKSNMSVGLSSNIELVLPVGLDKLLPSIPQLPQLTKDFTILDKCVNASKNESLPGDKSILIGTTVTTSEVEARLIKPGDISVTSSSSTTVIVEEVQNISKFAKLPTIVSRLDSVIMPPKTQLATSIASNTPIHIEELNQRLDQTSSTTAISPS